MNVQVLLQAYFIYKGIVDKIEQEHPNARGEEKLKLALEDIEPLIEGLGLVWAEVKPVAIKTIAKIVEIAQRIGGRWGRKPKPEAAQPALKIETLTGAPK